MPPTHRGANSDPPSPRADWGRVADGVFLAGLGVFFLLATTRGLPDGFWIEAVSFWPVLLVSAGIRLVFDKTPLPWGMLLGPAVVLTTLFWLAWGEKPPPLPPGEWHDLSAEQPEGTDRTRVIAHLSGVQVDMEARSLAPTLLAQGRAASRDATPRLTVDDDGDGQSTARLRGRQGGFMMIGTRREAWDLALTDRLPLAIDVEGVFIRTRADLRRGWLADAGVSGAFNAASFRLPPTTEAVNIRLEGAFSTFDVTVPEGTPVRLHGPGFPLNYLDKGPARDGISGEDPGYNLILEGAFCVLNIDEGPAPHGGWPALHPRREPAETPVENDEPGLPPENPDGGARPPAEAPPDDVG